MSERSIFLGSTLEAAHEAARKAYPIPVAREDIADGEVMALRGLAIAYGPRAIDHAEAVVNAAHSEYYYADLATFNEITRDQGEL